MNSIIALGLLACFGFSTMPLNDIGPYIPNIKDEMISIKELKFILLHDPIPITLDNPLTVSLYKTPHSYYQFNPSSDGYYVVETLGEYNTKLCVESTLTGRVFDLGNEKKDNNAKITFKATRGNKVRFFVAGDENGNCSTTLLLRKQKFSSFVFRAGTGEYDISTGNDNTVPNSLFNSNMNYTTYINNRYETIDGVNTTKDALNSEIVFFSGHGSPNSLVFANHTRLSFSYTQYLPNPYSVLDMRQTKLAFLSACQTADTSMCQHPEEDLCIAEFLVQQGAKCSVGFESTISTSDGKLFSDYFFNKFYQGWTVDAAIEYAKSNFSNGSPISSVKIFGDKNVTINSFETNGEFFIPPIIENIAPYKDWIFQEKIMNR